MDKRLKPKIDVIYAILAFCTANNSIVILYVAFDDAVLLLEAKKTAIETLMPTLVMTRGTASLNKTDLKKIMAQSTAAVAKKMIAYAAVQKDIKLKNLIKKAKSYSNINRMPDDEVAAFCTNILTLANNLLAPLAPYGMTLAEITAARTDVTNYANVISEPITEVTNYDTDLELLKVAVDEAFEIMTDQMDPLMINFQTSHPAFYIQYFRLRKIIDAPTRSQNLEITVLDPDGHGIPNAITAAAIKKGTFNTDIDGLVNITPIKAGRTFVTIQATGYQPFTSDIFTIEPKTKTEMTFTLTPIK